jgi:farnesyl-diphosphate farnesyltransferase
MARGTERARVLTSGRTTMADFDRLLLRTSRTFALAIPLLPEPLRHEVTIAYLLFRIADTFEDATFWSQAQRIAALRAFHALLQMPRTDDALVLAAAWLAARPCEHEGYLELLRESPAVLAAYDAFPAHDREVVQRHTLRTVEGMGRFVGTGTQDGGLRLGTLEELRAYCHVVAGIVGELLTDLFIAFAPSLNALSHVLRERAAPFGEGLQLVNILKDSASDARAGRVYFPPGVDREHLLDLARSDLRTAAEYVHTLQSAGAPRGVVAFTALPVLLARATLDRLEQSGPGTSIRRTEVMELFARLQQDLDRGASAVAPDEPTGSSAVRGASPLAS